MENYILIGTTKIWTTISDNVNYNKPYICLCGGGPGIGDSLVKIDDLIYKYFNVIRFEQRGCGRSTNDNNYSIETVLEDLDRIRKFYQINSWYLLGHSWGAGIALFYSLKYTEHCNGVIYISGMGIQNDSDWTDEFNNNIKSLNEPEIKLPDDFKINYDVLNTGLRSFRNYIKQPMLLKTISLLNIPVLILYGDQDIRPMWPTIQLSNLLPNCKMHILMGCNHFPWLQKPNELIDLVVVWLKTIEKGIKILNEKSSEHFRQLFPCIGMPPQFSS